MSLSNSERKKAIKRTIQSKLIKPKYFFKKKLYKSILKNKFYLIQSKEIYIISTQDKGISKDLFINGEYGLDHLYLARKILGIEKFGTLVDVGANIGVISIPALRRNLTENVICIEPSQTNFNLLKINIIINGLESRTKLVRAAAGSNVKNVNLHKNPFSYGDHEISRDLIKTNLVDIESVKTVRLDDVVGQLNRAKDLIWMDIQGYEMEALKGLSNNLEKRIPLVFEFWPKGLEKHGGINEIENLLNSYDCFIDLQDPQIEIRSISYFTNLYVHYRDNKNPRNRFTNVLVMSSDQSIRT